MSDLVRHSDLASTTAAFEGTFEASDLTEAKAVVRKTLESEFAHRVKIARIKYERDVIQPKLKELEATWTERNTTSLFDAS